MFIGPLVVITTSFTSLVCLNLLLNDFIIRKNLPGGAIVPS